jgi:hypothetical protein
MLNAKTFTLNIENSTYHAWTIEQNGEHLASIDDFTNEQDCVQSVLHHLKMWETDICSSLNSLLITVE